MAKWTGDLDMQRLQQGLDHPTAQEAQEAQEAEEILDLQVTHMALGEARS